MQTLIQGHARFSPSLNVYCLLSHDNNRHCLHHEPVFIETCEAWKPCCIPACMGSVFLHNDYFVMFCED